VINPYQGPLHSNTQTTMPMAEYEPAIPGSGDHSPPP